MYKFIAINTVMSDYLGTHFILETFKTFKEIKIIKFNTSYLLILAKIREFVSKNNFKKYLDFHSRKQLH